MLVHNLALMCHIVHRAVTAARSAPIEWIAISLQTKAGGFVGSACQNSRNAPAVWCSSSSIAFISLHSWKITWTSLVVLLAVHMSGMSTEIQWPRAELSFCSNHEGAGPRACWRGQNPNLTSLPETREGTPSLSPPGRTVFLFLLWESAADWESVHHCFYIVLGLVSTFHVDHPVSLNVFVIGIFVVNAHFPILLLFPVNFFNLNPWCLPFCLSSERAGEGLVV